MALHCLCRRAGVLSFVFYRLVDRLDRPIQLFNALGLSLFRVTGTAAAFSDGVAPFQAAILGAITGIGGGAVRDVLLGDTPVVLRRDLRAIPALFGGTIGAIAHAAGSDSGIFPIIDATACMTLWALGSRFGLELPTVKPVRQQPRPTKLPADQSQEHEAVDHRGRRDEPADSTLAPVVDSGRGSSNE